ncbi:hypothetical protein H6G80_17455 [Nostoc sp. FACHB-87]|uniref:hypothetical protein n=1 Tax=Nostocales TaxID=1161 RepID=UPI0016860838|nr:MULTISPECIES: hypothetical protein [Nostocales]MBD2455859.1 hypothetical protein [Nostoc sp. FACHB-87]MBD2478446.1 hypothetical protein [Anabaena sp. FACHB-83]MBD2490393.1 hypothetical protein [Aulosira sp. FACHB-615]
MNDADYQQRLAVAKAVKQFRQRRINRREFLKFLGLAGFGFSSARFLSGCSQPLQKRSPQITPSALADLPIRNPDTGKVIGVLRSQYSAAILQQLILQNNQLAGDFSFPILLDENHLRLAQADHVDQEAPTKHLFHPLVPLTSNRLAQLQLQGRLPRQPI